MLVATKAKLKSVPQTSSLTLSGSTIPLSHKIRNLEVYLDSNLFVDHHVNFLRRSVFLELRRTGHLVGATFLLMRRRSWFRLSFCQGWTTATLCWRVCRKTGRIACREYKTMQLVLSLAHEGEIIQNLCSDLSTGCQSELGLSTRFPPCAIVAEIHLLLSTCLIF